ncbi:hypothetical protein CISIN_1g0315771mg, partial [Citrus sinensis]
FNNGVPGSGRAEF